MSDRARVIKKTEVVDAKKREETAGGSHLYRGGLLRFLDCNTKYQTTSAGRLALSCLGRRYLEKTGLYCPRLASGLLLTHLTDKDFMILMLLFRVKIIHSFFFLFFFLTFFLFFF